MTQTAQWQKENYLISFDLVSLGKSGEEWIQHLTARGFPISDNAKKMLEAYVFRPTPAGTIHRVRILKGALWAFRTRSTRRICETAQAVKLRTPHPEIAPLMRDAFSDEEIRRMGLEEIATFHTPIAGRFLDIDTETGELESAPADQNDTWHKEHGFAFEV